MGNRRFPVVSSRGGSKPLRRTGRAGLALLPLVSVLTALTAILGITTAEAAPGSWQVSNTYPPALGPVNAVSCLTTTTCVAVGVAESGLAGVVAQTTNGGATWTRATLPAGAGLLAGVSCAPGTTTCFAVGTTLTTGAGVILISSDSGATWTNQNSGGAGPLSAVACASATHCFAVGTDAAGTAAEIFATTDGSTWASQSVPANTGAYFGVTCLATTDCFAVGINANDSAGIVASTTDGSTWNAQTLPAGIGLLGAVSCTSSSTCFAVGTDTTFVNGVVVATTSGGSSWVAQSVPGGTGDLYAISCLPSGATEDCYAAGTDPNFTTAVIIATTNGGATTWTSQSVPAGTSQLFGVSCGSTTTCEAVGVNSVGNLGVALGTTTSGATWSTQTLPAGLGFLNWVTCTSTTNCFAVGDGSAGGAVETTSNGGASWTSQSVPAETVASASISCTSSSDCIAVGSDAAGTSGEIIGTTNGGATWTSQSLPAGIGIVQSVACVSGTSTCFAVGNNSAGTGAAILTTTNFGATTWTSQAVPAGLGPLLDVTCASATNCYAVGIDSTFTTGVIVGTTDGSTWSSQTVPSGSGNLVGVSCTSTTTCYVVGSNSSFDGGVILATTTSGATWNFQSPPPGTLYLGGIDCPSAGTCFADGATPDATGVVLVTPNGGTTWNAQSVPAGTGPLASMACPAAPSPTTCFATGNTTSGGGLILSMVLPTPTVSTLNPTSGPTSGNTEVTVTGSNFSTAPGGTTIDFGGSPSTSVTCSSTTSCVAVSPPTSAGAVMVTATVLGQTSTTSASFTYLAPVPGPYTPLTPTRVCDTRPGNPSGLNTAPQNQCNGPGNTGETLSAGGVLSITVGGDFGVPANASAVVLNVTAANPAGAGYLTVFPFDQVPPTASNLNYVQGDVVPNLVEVGVGPSGQVSFYSSSATDVVVDLEGYVASTSGLGVGGGLYNPLASPARICDTRSGNPSSLSGGDAQCNGVTVSAGGTLPVQVTGNGGVPTPASGVSAVVLNITAVNPNAPGYLTVYPQGAAQPTASNVNYVGGQVVPNRVIVPVGPLGQIEVYSSSQSDVIVDVSGWYTASGGTTGTQFSAEGAPVRICDTRGGNPSGLSGGAAQCNGQTRTSMSTLTLNVSGLASVPGGAKAVVLNVTAVSPSQNTYLTIFPTGSPPTVSDLNPAPGEVEPNLVVATISNTGTIDIYNLAGTVDVVVDVLGWYS